MLANEMVTLPHPFEPDIEIRRQRGDTNYSRLHYTVDINCSSLLSSTSGCAEGNHSLLGRGNIDTSGTGELATEYTAWVGASEDILSVIFPIMLVWGVLSGFVNLIVLIRQISVSLDSYLIGFVIGNILLLLSGGLLKIEEYIGHQNWFQYIYGHVKTVNDWLWYTCLWLLLVMVLEKGSMVTQNRQKYVCSPVQACIVTLLVYVLTAISALPQLWKYEATRTWDYLTNTSIVMSHQSTLAEKPAYKLMYFWYVVTITVFLPFPLLTILMAMLVKGMKYAENCRQHMPAAHGSGNIMNKKVSEEIHLMRLFIVIIVLYMLFTGPFTFLNLVDHLNPHWNWPLDSVYPGLYCIFQFMFYFFFTIHFFLLCSYNDKFWHSLMKTCCCCEEERHFTQLKQDVP